MTYGEAINKSTKLAVVFDFDDTLAPDTTTQFLQMKGVDVDYFWKNRFKTLIEQGWEPTLAYLKLILDLTRPGETLEGLTNKELMEFGSKVRLYPGLPKFLDNIRATVGKYLPQGEIKIFVISGGLEPIIKGCSKISTRLDGFWACRLAGDENTDESTIKHIKRAISFTEKTRFLFHISKGQYPAHVDRNPACVNEYVPFEQRPIPFHNFIYVGDGYTDIPCFSLLIRESGAPIGIKHDSNDPSAKQKIIRDILFAQRTLGMHLPDYRKRSELYSEIENAIAGICSRIGLRLGMPT